MNDPRRQVSAAQQQMRNENKGENGAELGREELKKKEQNRHLEKAVMKSVEEDSELRRAEEEHKGKLVEIDDARGTKVD